MKSLLILASMLCFASLQAQVQDSIVTKDAVLHYSLTGKGKPVIILSGGPGVASGQEDDLAREIAKKHQAVLFDQRGTGKSWTKPMNKSTINLDVAIEDLERLRQKLNQDKIAIAGHSWGGMLACAYADKYPERVSSLVLIGAGELDMAFSPVVSQNIRARRQLSDSTEIKYWRNAENSKRDPEKAAAFRKRMAWKAFTYDQAKLDKVLEQANHGSYSEKMGDLMWDDLKDRKFNITKTLPQKYKNPALVVFGWQDPVGSITVSMYEKAIPQAQIHGINQCGHMPSVEQPQEFYQTVMAFLDKNL